ncbi:hypothetical protein DSL72_002759 [Monilinia vaccinii-corymbosi]|uniref:2EXR domain-containing protein n=1 Tax=Monilinia vaccinii-corymbosi TaxID=61207 RepID=A0A8A3PDM1_9HELO|nr:hypothetical protein DSL72_002759 [Monilinia vaccinii-corymbosi]
MDLPICIDGVHTGCDKLRYVLLKNTKLKSIFGRPGFKIADRRKLYNRLVRENWEVYRRHIQSIKSEKLEKTVPFKRFSDLPPEIRDLIWGYSLPGPRILYLNRNPHAIYDKITQSSPKWFKFLKYHNPPNPSALLTCRASRAVALKRYRIIPEPSFGLVYTDFAGGDILYIDEHNFMSFVAFPWSSTDERKSCGLDLTMVEWVALAAPISSPGMLRWGMAEFLQGLPKLKQILLDVSPRKVQWSHGPGTIQMEDLSRVDNLDPFYQLVLAQRNLMLNARSEDDRAKGLRNVTLISTCMVTDFPKRDWLVDMAKHDGEYSLLLKKLREKMPANQEPKSKPPTGPANESAENPKAGNTVKSP